MYTIRRLFSMLRGLFSRGKGGPLGSREETHWVNHIHDEFIPPPNPAVQWYNLHGFDEGPGATYWVGGDVRTFGIRSADFVVRCRNRSTYEDYAGLSPTEFQSVMKHDPRLT